MPALMERQNQQKSAAERDLYDETPQEVLDAFKQLGFANDAEREQLARLSDIPGSDETSKVHWIQLRAM